jgi:hypothetical protein
MVEELHPSHMIVDTERRTTRGTKREAQREPERELDV